MAGMVAASGGAAGACHHEILGPAGIRPARPIGIARAPRLLRILSAQDAGDGEEAVADGEAHRAAGAALRLGHLRRRRLDPRAHPRHRAAHPQRYRARACRASHLHRRAARGDRQCRAALLGFRHPARGGAPGRRARGQGRYRPYEHGYRLCRRSGGGPPAHRRFRDQRRGISRNPSRGQEPRSRSRQSEAQDRRWRRPRHHSVLLRGRNLSALHRPRPRQGHQGAHRSRHPAGHEFRPGQEIRQGLRRGGAGLDGRRCSTGSTTIPIPAAWWRPRSPPSNAGFCRRTASRISISTPSTAPI